MCICSSTQSGSHCLRGLHRHPSSQFVWALYYHTLAIANARITRDYSDKYHIFTYVAAGHPLAPDLEPHAYLDVALTA